MFANILKELRTELHISQAKLAKSIGVSPGNISTWESGEAKPGYAALYALAQFFEVSADYLLELSPQKMGISRDPENKFYFLDSIKKEQGLMCDDSPLEDEEADLIAMYRLLPSNVREDMFDQLYCLYRKYVERKKESIYWTYKEDEKSGTADNGDQSGTA